MTSVRPQGFVALKMMQSVLSDSYYHHSLTFSPPGPARTYPELMALTKWPNITSATSKRDEEIDNRKHLLGVLKGKDRLGSETLRILAREHGK